MARSVVLGNIIVLAVLLTGVAGVRAVEAAPSRSCARIQRAINALPPSGGEVLVKRGVYVCKTAIVIDRDGVCLRGQGPGTVLRLADGANAPVLVIGGTTTPPAAPRRGACVSDLAIDGNREAQAFECWGGPCDTGGLTFIRNNGITLRGVTDVVIERVTVSRAASGGLVAEKGCRRITVRSLTSFDNAFDGLAAYETEDSTFTGLHIHGNAFAGISVDIGFDRNVVGEAIVSGNGKPGVFMRDARDNVFHALQIRDSGEDGFFLAQVDGDASRPAAGNTFNGVVVTGSARAGLRVNDPSCVDNLVTGSQFAANGDGCVSEAAPELVVSAGIICR